MRLWMEWVVRGMCRNRRHAGESRPIRNSQVEDGGYDGGGCVGSGSAAMAWKLKRRDSVWRMVVQAHMRIWRPRGLVLWMRADEERKEGGLKLRESENIRACTPASDDDRMVIIGALTRSDGGRTTQPLGQTSGLLT